MKTLCSALAVVLFATLAQAQTAAQPATTTQPATMPANPVSKPPISHLPPAPNPEQGDINATRRPSAAAQQQSMGQMMVIGTVLSCTQKGAGADKARALYMEMQKTGKTIQDYCKAGREAEARQLLLNAINAKQSDPAVQMALACYDSQGIAMAKLAGPDTAQMADQYVGWFRNPDQAQYAIKESDVCRHSKITTTQY